MKIRLTSLRIHLFVDLVIGSLIVPVDRIGDRSFLDSIEDRIGGNSSLRLEILLGIPHRLDVGSARGIDRLTGSNVIGTCSRIATALGI